MDSSTKTALSTRRRRHLEKLKDFAADLERSVNTVFPTGATQYGHVAVLGITWSNDKMGCEASNENLFAVLRKQYGFSCKSLVLDHQQPSPAQDLHHEISAFHKKHDGTDALLIYVYSGHATAPVTGGMEWGGEIDANGDLLQPTVDWLRVRGHTESANARVLYIFDCCCAGAGGVHDGPEIVGAAGWSAQASSSAQYSFTKILADHLASLQGKPQTVSQIYTQICRNVVSSQLEQHAVHFHQRGKESVVLEPTPQASKAFGTQSAKARADALQQMGKGRDKVIISVHLMGEIGTPDLQQWEKWLKTNMPRMVELIKIEAMYHGESTVMIVSMPLEVWDGLPDNKPAYNFLSFVKSGNLIARGNQPPPFAITDRTKKENIPYGEGSRQGAKR